MAQGDKPCHKVYGERGMVGVGGLFCGDKVTNLITKCKVKEEWGVGVFCGTR